MNENDSFAQTSYRIHETQYQSPKATESFPAWMLDDTVDAWRHRRMHQLLDPLLGAYPATRWLTVGDGRCGTDAHYLQTHGVNAHASDISDTLLAKAHEAGYINAFSKENAERLSFADDSFDFVLCKEAYHHFPRPMVALYEMLRVAREGVILIEPDDTPALFGRSRIAKMIAKAALIRVAAIFTFPHCWK